MGIVNENSTKPVFIKIYYNEIELGTATGFQIHQGHKYLVTNWHVVSGRNLITKQPLNNQGAIPNRLLVRYKKFIDSDDSEWTEQEISIVDENGNKMWYEHPEYGDKVDVALIPLELYPRFQTYKECFNHNTNYELEVTDDVFVLGFPLGYTVKSKEEPHAVWTSGVVASDPSINLVVNKEEVPAFLIDSKTRQGQSGSPVIYYSGKGIDFHPTNGGMAMWGRPFMKEIGIYSGRINADSDLGYVWKWSIIKEIVDAIEL